MKAAGISCLALCVVGSAALGNDWVLTGAVTTKADWEAAGTNWSTVVIRIQAPEMPFHQIRFIYNPTNGLVDPERCSWLPEPSLPPWLTEAQLPRLKCPATIPALVSARFGSRCRLTFAADRWDPGTQRSGQIALRNLEWILGDVLSQDAQEIFKQIARQLPELKLLGETNGTSSSSEVWKGEEYATAHYGNESDTFALSITIHRYASAGAAQEDVKKGFGMRPALPPPQETYKGARLHRYASGGNAICQLNQYIIEIIPGPRSGVKQTEVMKALDAALAELGN